MHEACKQQQKNFNRFFGFSPFFPLQSRAAGRGTHKEKGHTNGKGAEERRRLVAILLGLSLSIGAGELDEYDSGELNERAKEVDE